MSESRSENQRHEATPHKLATALARGDRVSSAEWVSAALLLVLCVWASSHGLALWAGLCDLAHEAFAGRAPGWSRGWALIRPLALVFGALPAAALLVSSAQRGFAFGSARAERDVSSAQRLADAFGSQARQAFALRFIKLAVLSTVLLSALRGSLPGLTEAWRRDTTELLRSIGHVARSLGWRAVWTFAVLGSGELLYQRWRRARRLRMTRRELEHERRETEGDPVLVRERRERSRALWARASLAELDSATLVIAAANRALALRYRPDRDAAPVLWIKAEGALGMRLVMQAHALALPVYVDETLAQDLYRLEPSQAIPRTAHERVAALLVDRG